MQGQAVSGSDYFHLLLDRKMLRNGLVGNISRIHLQLEQNVDLNCIAQQLSQNQTFQRVVQLKVVHRWPLPPKWEVRDCLSPRRIGAGCSSFAMTPDNSSLRGTKQSLSKYIQVHSAQSTSEFNTTVLNRKMDNDNGLGLIELCELDDGKKKVVITNHHVLFDHQGMVNFVKALADETVSFPLFPTIEKQNGWRIFRNFWFMTFYMLKRSSSKLGTLVGKNIRPAAPPTFKIIEFSESETKQIEKNAWKAGSRIGQSAFYISATAKIVNQTLTKRNEKPPYLWFSVPNNQRKKGSSGHLISNQLSFLFFRLSAKELDKTEAAVEAINHQLKAQIKNCIAARYTDLLHALRFMPLPVYEAMVNLASNGKMSSFGFSDLGTDKLNLNKFLGAKVKNSFHYPPVPSPPGFNVVVSKNNEKLKFVWAYFDEVINPEEVNEMEQSFRDLLL